SEIKSRNIEPIQAIAYGSDTSPESRKFRAALRAIGFVVKFTNRSSWAVDMALDLTEIIESVDVVVFVSSNGDIASCVKYVNSRGRQSMVIGSKISNQLVAAADTWSEIGEELL